MMRILFISGPCCIRVCKMGLALVDAGHRVAFWQQSCRQDMLDELPELGFYSDNKTLYEKLSALDPDAFDVIHVHNEPSDIATVAKLAQPTIPMVFDCHDIELCRESKTATDDEVSAFNHADAVIVPSKAYLRAVKKEFPRLRDIPVELIYTMAPRRWVDRINRNTPSVPKTVAHQGGTGLYPDHINYLGCIEALSKANFSLMVFPILVSGGYRSDEIMSAYINAGALWMQPLFYWPMISNIGRCTWALCGSDKETVARHKAVPNKIFDAVLAGVPIVVQKAEEAGEYVREHRIGIEVDSLENLSVLDETARVCRARIASKWPEFTMESQLPKLIGVYEEISRGKR